MGQTIRYGMVGVLVGLVHLGLPVLLNSKFRIQIEIVIPAAYVTAATLHFNLQRRFVFRHVEEVALTTREQIRRYAAAGAFQYPAAGLATAFLPSPLGVSQRAVFVCATLAVSLTAFLVYRVHIFHGSTATEARPSGSTTCDGWRHTRSAPEADAAEVEFVRRGRGRDRPDQVDLDPVEPQMNLDRQL